jgi:prolyl oligopeptidase
MKVQKTRRSIVLFLSGFIILKVALAADPGAPKSDRHAVTDVYHQVTVSDPYRWLEDGAAPKVHEWSAAQDARTRKYLDELPQRAPIFNQLPSQISATSSSYHGLRAVGTTIFGG